MKKTASTSLLISLLLAGCSPREAAPVPAPHLASAPVRPRVAITTCVVSEASMPRSLSFTGELKGAQEAMLAPDVAGKVIAAPIERGSVVNQGDVILQLDDRTAALALQESEASLEEARLKLEWSRNELARNQSLVKTSAVSALEFERMKLNKSTAEAALAAAEARRDSARKALSDTTLRAPFDGMVVERLTEAGEYVTSSTRVARLVATKKLRLVIQVPETEVGQVREGQMIRFTVPAYPQAKFTGSVKHVGAALREETRDLAIEAEVQNEDGRLKPGMFAEGQLALAEQTSLALPAAALRLDGDTHRVFVVRDGVVEERIVEVGQTKDDLVEIREGVSANEVVVLSPGAEAADGMQVAVASHS